MTEALQRLVVEVDVQEPLSLGRAALDHKVDLIPYAQIDLRIIVGYMEIRRTDVSHVNVVAYARTWLIPIEVFRSTAALDCGSTANLRPEACAQKHEPGPIASTASNKCRNLLLYAIL